MRRRSTESSWSYTAVDAGFLIERLPPQRCRHNVWRGSHGLERQGGGAIASVYHYLYNFAHTYLVVGAGVGVWAWVIGGFEWAMLAVPLHLAIDRGIFGNVFKPVTLAFEPVAAPPDVVAAALGRKAGINNRV